MAEKPKPVTGPPRVTLTAKKGGRVVKQTPKSEKETDR